MRKLSEYQDGDALDLLADIMEPAVVIMGDDDVRAAFDEGSKIKGVSAAIKAHKAEVLQILARLEGVDVEEYHCNVFTLPGVILDVLNDRELLSFFTEQARMRTINASSGRATETTEGGETKEA